MDFENPNIQDLINKILLKLKSDHGYDAQKVFKLMCGINLFTDNNFIKLVDLYYDSPLSKYQNLSYQKVTFIKSQIQYTITKERKRIINHKNKLNELRWWVSLYMRIGNRKKGQIKSVKQVIIQINKCLGGMLLKIVP